ncbi:tetratricopeptide repeat protein [Patescibacteria group bacterium]|nr:tetratricopeptide repeat protein [Patescibacteria group bacterium]
MKIMAPLKEKFFLKTKINLYEKIVYWILLATVFLSPIFFLSPNSFPLEFNKVLLFNILVWLAASLFLLRGLLERRLRLVRTHVDWLILAYVVFYLISTLFSDNYYASLVGLSGYYSASLISTISFILFFYLLINVIKDYRDIIRFIVVFLTSSLIVVGHSLFQYNGVWLLPGDVASIIQFNLVSATSVGLGVFVAVSLVLGVGVILIKKIKLFYVAGGILVAADLALLFYISNNTILYIMAAGMLLFLFIASLQSKRISNWWVILPTVVITIVILFLFIDVASLLSVAPSDSIRLDNTTSAVIAWESLKQSPLWGSGPQTFASDFFSNRPISFNESPLWNLRFIKASNEWWGALATLGIGATLSWLGIIFLFFRKYTRVIFTAKKIDNSWSLSVILFIAWVIMVISSLVLPFSFIMYFLFWFLLALIHQSVTDNIRHYNIIFGSAKGRSIKIISGFGVVIIISVLVIFFGIRGWLADYHFIQAQRGIAQQADFDVIESSLNKAIKLNPYESSYYISLAQGYATQAQIMNSRDGAGADLIQQVAQQVIDNIKLSKEADQNNPVTYEREAALYDSLRNIISNVDELSITAYAKAVALEPTSPLAHLNLGRARLLQAQGLLELEIDDKSRQVAGALLEQAIGDFRKAKSLKKDFVVADFNITLALELKGDLSAAADYLEGVLKGYPDNPDILFSLASLYYDLDDLDKSLSFYQQVLDAVPEYTSVYWQRSIIFEDQGDVELAIVELEKLLEIVPNDAQVLERLNILAGQISEE